MSKYRFYAVLATAFVSAILLAGCHKTPTEDTYEPQVLLSQLSVSTVPGGDVVIRVAATDEHNQPRTFTAACDDEGVATVTKTDSTITISGLAYGTTNITVNSDTNSRVVPVEVYDPKVMEAGELLIAFVDTFEYRWSSSGGIAASFYHPVTTDGFCALGSLAFAGSDDPSGKSCIMVVKAKPGSDALKPPVGYEQVWYPSDTGSFWNPIPPAGYKALGSVVSRDRLHPSLADVVCVREDLTIAGALGGELYGYDGGYEKFASYAIDAPDAGPHESCYTATGTFSASRLEPDPTGHPVLFVLKVKLPSRPEAADQTFAPKLTGFDTPADRTVPLTCREMVIPWTIVKDTAFSTMWRYANSPKYRLEREVFYQLRYHNYNQTSQVQTNSVTLTSGVSKTESETYWVETGISVTAEGGVDLKIFSAKVSATVSLDLGYETQTSVTELQEKEIQSSINTPPGKAAALWQKFNRFTLKRQNGTSLAPVKVWEFGIDSYVTDEYPND